MGFVYRYIDKEDNIIKYVGIVYGKCRTLKNRIEEHKTQDWWAKGKSFKIEYITEKIETRTDAEYFESHFISLYNTDKWFNKSKAGWGVSLFLPNRENDWVEYHDTDVLDDSLCTNYGSSSKDTIKYYKEQYYKVLAENNELRDKCKYLERDDKYNNGKITFCEGDICSLLSRSEYPHRFSAMCEDFYTEKVYSTYIWREDDIICLQNNAIKQLKKADCCSLVRDGVMRISIKHNHFDLYAYNQFSGLSALLDPSMQMGFIAQKGETYSIYLDYLNEMIHDEILLNGKNFRHDYVQKLVRRRDDVEKYMKDYGYQYKQIKEVIPY